MRRELVILLVLCSVFMAIGCASNTDNNTQKPATPAETPSIPIENPATTPVSTATSETGGEGKTVDVSIKDFAFNPEAVTISAGDTVKWTNLDSATHTIKGPDFESDTLRDGDSYSFVFAKAGVYEYECSLHPSMKGTVTVTE
jgi:plastocyanin